MDTINPEWPTQFVVNYYFESIQEVTIRIYDKDGKSPASNLRAHEFCGEGIIHELTSLSSPLRIFIDLIYSYRPLNLFSIILVTFNLSTLMCNNGQQLSVNLSKGRSHGACTIRAGMNACIIL